MLKLPHIQVRRVKGSQVTKKEEKRIRYENMEGSIEGEKGNEEEEETRKRRKNHRRKRVVK